MKKKIISLGVRLIRDHETSVGKGFGYVLFEVCEFIIHFLYYLISRMKHQLH